MHPAVGASLAIAGDVLVLDRAGFGDSCRAPANAAIALTASFSTTALPAR
jgi:hypothetical protein